MRRTGPESAAYQSLVKFQIIAFHLTKFKTTSSSEWNSIFQNFQREANFARCTQIFGNFFPKVFFPFNFCPGIFRIFGLVIVISQIQQFLWFLETFLWNVCTICHCFQILESLVEWKAPQGFLLFLTSLFFWCAGKTPVAIMSWTTLCQGKILACNIVGCKESQFYSLPFGQDVASM